MWLCLDDPFVKQEDEGSGAVAVQLFVCVRVYFKDGK